MKDMMDTAGLQTTEMSYFKVLDSTPLSKFKGIFTVIYLLFYKIMILF